MCAEPVLLVGFQDMYSNVFKVLMQHRSIVHMEQVEWAMDEPLGVMLPDLHGKAVPAKYKRLPLDTEVLPITESELAPTHTPTEGGMLEGGMHEGGITPGEGGHARRGHHAHRRRHARREHR